MKHPEHALLLAHFDCELDEPAAQAVDAHMRLCATCRRRRANLVEAMDALKGAAEIMDTIEPMAWSTPAVQPLPGAVRIPVIRPPSRGGMKPRLWLRAAVLVLMLGATAGVAALLRGPLLSGSRETPTPSDEPRAGTHAPPQGGGMIGVPLAAGMLDVFLSGAAPGATVTVQTYEGDDVVIDVAGTAAPRFRASTDHVLVQLDGPDVSVRVLYPRHALRGSVRHDGREVARVRDGVVTQHD